MMEPRAKETNKTAIGITQINIKRIPIIKAVTRLTRLSAGTLWDGFKLLVEDNF